MGHVASRSMEPPRWRSAAQSAAQSTWGTMVGRLDNFIYARRKAFVSVFILGFIFSEAFPFRVTWFTVFSDLFCYTRAWIEQNAFMQLWIIQLLPFFALSFVVCGHRRGWKLPWPSPAPVEALADRARSGTRSSLPPVHPEQVILEPDVHQPVRGDGPKSPPIPRVRLQTTRAEKVVVEELVETRRPWLDPKFVDGLAAVEHHLEIIDDEGSKLDRLKRLMQFYYVIRSRRFIIVANMKSVQRIMALLQESFVGAKFESLDFQVPEPERKAAIKSFESGHTSALVLDSSVSTRKKFLNNLSTSNTILVNFHFPMTLQLYLNRIYMLADRSNAVYTFFSSQFDIKHTEPLIFAMEAANQTVPPSLLNLKGQLMRL